MVPQNSWLDFDSRHLPQNGHGWKVAAEHGEDGMNEERIDVGGVAINAVTAGEGPVVLMIHGFPGLSWSWRHQMQPLADAGFKAVAIDSLGYGKSDRPAEQHLYDSDHMQRYLLAILDHFGAKDAFIIGQDFGAQYAWNLAVRAPERVRALVTTIPYDYDLAGRAMLGSAPSLPAGSPPQPVMASTDHPPSLRFAAMAAQHFLHFHYFQEVGPADRELGNKLAEFLKRDFYALSADGNLWNWTEVPTEGAGYLDALPPTPPLPWPWLSEAEFDRFVAGYDDPVVEKRAIGGLNSYRTADANWEIGRAWADHDVTVPTLFVYGAKDPSFGFFPEWRERMERRVPGLVDVVEIADAGHFIQQEQPDAFNRVLIDFLKSR
ncbi:Pimeloyl-ACP methyl ester carboxylesterase [Sphingomonas laterariae]|uniref:Pimeloyl-ACP methyl ester carboxylesterase n=1 Tax=Edaphosphingomonas laterariae TaxID=861865 RepID=A0A239J107_9SPHN|nr:alpha/beta hydrolase [Sphingomonas laterariae]SNS99736.1 Pimeloyl-ACP methyl ester carboxylesterase [Sphingomonas laterariae]